LPSARGGSDLSASLVIVSRNAGEPAVSPTDGIWLLDLFVKTQRFLEALPSGIVVGTCQGDVAEALDAIGLAEDVADALVEGSRFLEALASALVVGTFQGDVAEAFDAIGLAEDVADALVEGQRFLEALASGLVVGTS
jgi:hypothetical protein